MTTQELVESARLRAQDYHGAQKYGDEPYMVHLEAVVANLRQFGHGEDAALLAAGYLHDTVEDTGMTLDILQGSFGKDVTELVSLVTDKPGKTRKERQAATFPLTRVNKRAVALKLADRLANVSASMLPGQEARMKRYYAEHASFTKMLFVEGGGNLPMWQALGKLMFEHVSGVERRAVSAKVMGRRKKAR